MTARIKISQVGRPAGVAGFARTDGLATGALVTLENVGSLGATVFRLLWRPTEDTTAVSSLVATGNPNIWTFSPTALCYGSYLIELVEDGVPIERRVFGIRTPLNNLLIPAFNERASRHASLVNPGADQKELSENNATDFSDAALNLLNYAGYWRSLLELYRKIESITGGLADHSVPYAKLPSAAAAPSVVGASVNGNLVEMGMITLGAALAPAVWEQGTDNTGGAAISLGEGGVFKLITSTTAITSFAFVTNRVGRSAVIVFATVRTLTHNAVSLILPGGVNITTAAGDVMRITSLGSGNFRVDWYTRASGLAIVHAAASDTAAGGIEIATAAEVATGTDAVRAVVPARAGSHQSAAKFWVTANTTGTILDAYNVTSITDVGVGVLTVTISTNFANANWCGQVSVEGMDASLDSLDDVMIAMISPTSKAVGSATFQCAGIADLTDPIATVDPFMWNVVGFGDQ